VDNQVTSSHPPETPDEQLLSKPEQINLDRRKFFKLFGGGLAVAFVLKDIFSLAEQVSPPETSLIPVS
jgi:hypothetical protein